MQREVDLQRIARQSLDYDRALETLSTSLCPSSEAHSIARKAMGPKDLLIKVCQSESVVQSD